MTVVIAGEVHIVFTVTGIFTAVLNSTVQVRMEEDPAITLTGWVTVTTVGAGTERKMAAIYDLINAIIIDEQNLTNYFHNATLLYYLSTYSGLTCIGTSIRCLQWRELKLTGICEQSPIAMKPLVRTCCCCSSERTVQGVVVTSN